MTRRRNHNARCQKCNVDAICPICREPVSSATPNSDWLRDQEELDSSLGYVATNIDYMWSNHKTGRWIFLEEKRYMALPTDSQRKLFEEVDAAAQTRPGYGGFWILTFEKTNAEDGRIWLYRLNETGGEITKEQLLRFLVDVGPATCNIDKGTMTADEYKAARWERQS